MSNMRVFTGGIITSPSIYRMNQDLLVHHLLNCHSLPVGLASITAAAGTLGTTAFLSSVLHDLICYSRLIVP